jgi:PKD repeat protein
VRLIGTTQHGCKDTADKAITVRPDAKAEFTFQSNLACAPFSITQSNIVGKLYLQANSSYEWYADDSLIGTGIQFPGYIITQADDSVSIKLKAISIAGCKNDSVTVVFRTIPNPKPYFNFVDSIGCTPFTTTIINLSTPTTGVNYLWLAGNQTSTVQNPTFTARNFGVADTIVNIKLIVTVGNTGCKDSIDKNVIVKPLPRPNFTFAGNNLCFPQKINVSNATLTPPQIDLTGYKWKATGATAAVIENDTTSSNTSISIPDNQSGSNRFYDIKLIATSDFGCKDSIVKNISVPSRPVADFDFVIDSLCSYLNTNTTNATIFATGYQWKSLSNHLIISNPNAFNTQVSFVTHSGDVDSVYRLRLVATNNDGCLDSIEKNIITHPKPIATYLPDTNIGCTPLTISFANNTIASEPASYLWTLENGINSTLKNPTYTFNGSILYDTNYIVRMISTSKYGCKDTTQQTIIAKSGAVAVISSLDSVYCMNTALQAKISFFNSSFGDADSFFYDFDDGNTFVTTRDTAFSNTYLNEGIYNVKLVAKNICKTSTDSVQIKVLKAPDPSFTISDTLGCGPLKVKFNNSTTNFEASYFWDFGNGQTSSLKQPDTITYIQSKLIDTVYIVKLTVSNKCGVVTIQDSIRVLPLPVASFVTSLDSGCSPLTVGFLNTTTGLPLGAKWYFGNGDSSVRYNPPQQVFRTEDTATIYTITMIAFNTCGIDTARKQILVKPNTVRAFFNSSGNFGCAPYTVIFTDKSIGGTNLSWNFGNGQTSNLSNPTVTYINPGTYTVFQYVNNGCSYDTSIMLIEVQPTPQFTISKNKATACVNEPIQFTSNLVDSGSITWYFSLNDSSNLFNPTFAFSTPGLKIIKVVLKSLFSPCTTTLYDSVMINDLPTLPLSIDTNQGCVYKTFVLSAGNSTGQFFTWYMGDGNTRSGRDIIYTYSTAGVFNIKLISETSLGCIDSITTTVTTYPKPSAAFDYNPKDTCQGPVNVRFSNLTTGAIDYLWQFGNNKQSIEVNPTVIYEGVGTYNINLIANNQYGCLDTAKAVYTVYNIPDVKFDFNPSQGCQPLKVQFTNTTLHGSVFRWDFGDGKTSIQENPEHTYLSPGTYDVKLIVTEGGICTDSTSKIKAITVHPKPTSAFDWKLDSTIRPYSTLQYFNLSTGSVNYIWEFGDGKISNLFEPSNRFSFHGIYTTRLIVISDKGCSDTFDFDVEIPEYKKGLFVPNALTPDYGQEEVRKFKPVGAELENYHIYIYNKFGNLIWESTLLVNGSPAEGWDGNDLQGKPLPQGVYIWFVNATFTDGALWNGQYDENRGWHGTVQRPGNVTLIR